MLMLMLRCYFAMRAITPLLLILQPRLDDMLAATHCTMPLIDAAALMPTLRHDATADYACAIRCFRAKIRCFFAIRFTLLYAPRLRRCCYADMPAATILMIRCLF